MPRSFGRVLASIWDDDDFRERPPCARLVYIFLFSQPDLDHAGVIPLRKPRWVRALAVGDGELEDALGELATARYVVIDETEGELLVRSLIRRDDIWRQPNVFKAAAAAALAAKSGAVKAALLAELRRLDLSDASKESQRIRADLLTRLEPFGNPSPTPPDGQPRAPEGTRAGKHRIADPDIPADSGIIAGQNPSATLPEPFANPSPKAQGKGSSYGPVLHASPFPYPSSPTPSPSRPAGRDVQSPLMAAVPGARPEEGGEAQPEEETRDADALVASLREMRPDWTAVSIRQALAKPGCTERPWELVWAAAHLMAEDPGTNHPGRLPHDGPWWPAAAAQLRLLTSKLPARPAWCGECDEVTRKIVTSPTRGLVIGEDRPRPCPNCSPKARSA